MTAAAQTNGRAATDTAFPVDTFKDAAPHLRRPFTTAAVKFKVQASWSGGALIVSYIDARLVVERLNLVCPDLWVDTYEPSPGGLMWCHLTIDGLTRRDVGEGQGKGLVSDALKRAAVRFGVGVSLYAIPKMILNDAEGLKRKQRGQKESVELTDAGERLCRARYAEWLAAHGTDSFGEPLEHGDVEDAQGDHEVQTPQGVDPATGEVTPAEPEPTITKKRAGELAQSASDIGILDTLQLAATHVRGEDVGDCSTLTAATEALRALTVSQADKVEHWINGKADKIAAEAVAAEAAS